MQSDVQVLKRRTSVRLYEQYNIFEKGAIKDIAKAIGCSSLKNTTFMQCVLNTSDNEHGVY